MAGTSDTHKETIVVGAGPAGYVAAIRASQLGQKVTIVENTYIGGTCLNIGCIPTKALITVGHRYRDAQTSQTFGVTSGKVSIDMEATQKWKNEQVIKKLTGGVSMLLKKNKVETIEGTASFKDDKTMVIETKKGTTEEYTFDNVILATGTSARTLEEMPFGGRILSTTDVLNVTELPESVVIVGGGGYVGSQLAGVLTNFGAKVTILEKEDRLAHFFDKDMSDLLEKTYANKGIDIVTGANIKSAEQSDNDITITYEKDGKEQTVTSSVAVVTVGRVPNLGKLKLENTGVKVNDEGKVEVDNRMQTNVEGIYAIGDIVPGTMLADEAMAHGKVVAEAISGKEPEALSVIPMAIYTEPEMATVGMSADEAKKAGKRYKASKFPLAANGRALSLNETDGFVRLITDEEQDGKVVGAQLAGPSAADLSGMVALSIETGQIAEDLALTIQGHPSIGEAIMDAAELALGMPIHI